MKNAILFVICVVGLLAGCRQTDKTIPGNLILRQVNAHLKATASDQLISIIEVGTYECNDASERLDLRKLQAAGLITYDVKRYVWWEKSKITKKRPYEVTHGYYFTWTETKYRNVQVDDYSFCDHYIVDVSLTPAGQELVLEKLPAIKANVDDDMIQPLVDDSLYAWNQTDLSEDWPVIPNPFLPAPKEEDATKTQAAPKETKSAQTKAPEVARIDSLQYKAYNSLSLDSRKVILNAGSRCAVKARNIQRIDNGIVTANAEVIVETMKVTDAGRILLGIENGEKTLEEVTMVYYQDKGWILNTLNDF